MSEYETDKIRVGANGPWVHDNDWAVFTTVCGEKFLATCEEWFQQESVDGVVLTNAISFRIELVQQQGGIVRMPIVGGVDLWTEPAVVHARICSAYSLREMGDDDKKQYLSLIRHALRQMSDVRARRSGLVLP